MNSNIALAPAPRLMQDIMPPYAAALTRVQNPISELQKQEVNQSIPVRQEAENEPVMFPHQPDQTDTQQQAHPQPRQVQEAEIVATAKNNHQPTQQKATAPKTNWLIIGAAVLVSLGLLFAAYLAFKQNY